MALMQWITANALMLAIISTFFFFNSYLDSFVLRFSRRNARGDFKRFLIFLVTVLVISALPGIVNNFVLSNFGFQAVIILTLCLLSLNYLKYTKKI
jgi:hypothetical protein